MAKCYARTAARAAATTRCARKPSVLLETTRLQFDTKITLAHALSGDLPDPKLWAALDNLNKIRNSLAHRLADSNLQNLRRAFVRSVAQMGVERSTTQDKDDVYVGSMGYIMGVIDGMTPLPDD